MDIYVQHTSKAGADMSAKVTERLEEVRRMSTASGPSAMPRASFIGIWVWV